MKASKPSIFIPTARHTYLFLILAGSLSFAQPEATSTQQTTQGDCSPIIDKNSNSTITFNCITTKAAREKRNIGPRERLAREGINWTNESFGDALTNGDIPALKLFLSEGFNIYGEYREQHAVTHFITHEKKTDRTKSILKLLIAHGLDIDHEFGPPSRWPTLAEHAVRAGNVEAFRIIWKSSKRREEIRRMVNDRIVDAQQEQHRSHDRSHYARHKTRAKESLLNIFRITHPDNKFSLVDHKIERAPHTRAGGRAKNRTPNESATWFLQINTTSLIRRVTYEFEGKSRSVDWTTRLPLEISTSNQGTIPVQIKAVDLIGRRLGPTTIEIDTEDLREH